MTMTHLFFFMEAVLMQGVGRLNLGNTSKLDEISSSLLFGSTCRASYLLCKGTWEGGVLTEEMCLLRRAGTCRHCPLSLKSLHSARRGEDRESSASCVLSACRARLRGGRVRFQYSLSLSRTP